VKKDQIVFIPAGMEHSLSNTSNEPFEIFEIYAPAGDKFDFILCE
jgi:mannose-6-phosphate isomerase-like protein (cupin superfamily)